VRIPPSPPVAPIPVVSCTFPASPTRRSISAVFPMKTQLTDCPDAAQMTSGGSLTAGLNWGQHLGEYYLCRVEYSPCPLPRKKLRAPNRRRPCIAYGTREASTWKFRRRAANGGD